MTKHVHGGNIYQYKDCIDFSANCNPLGTPEKVKEAVIESLSQLGDYPQVGYGPLREALGRYEGVKPEQVVCGNGAAELIYTLCHALMPKRALVPAPTFAEYPQALESTGCRIREYLLLEEENFVLGEKFLGALDENTDIVFLCNPNNPTGVLIEREVLTKILKRCRELDIFLVVDECFLDFVKKPENYSLKAFLEEYDNLFLLKAFTKRYAMAGIRLGYGLCGNRSILKRMEGCVQPWNLSVMAQAAGIAALKEEEYVKRGRKLVFQEADRLKRELSLLGFQVYPSCANYLFFRGPEDLFSRCIKEGILIRDCSNYSGLKKGYYRVAVKTEEENDALINALAQIQRNE